MLTRIIGCHATLEVFLNGEKLDITESQRLYNHSQDFNWGYCGSGPAQLALSILLKYVPPKKALSLYQTFKTNIISLLPQNNFEIEIDINNWLKTQGEVL